MTIQLFQLSMSNMCNFVQIECCAFWTLCSAGKGSIIQYRNKQESREKNYRYSVIEDSLQQDSNIKNIKQVKHVLNKSMESIVC